jgi:hypothetical protein
MSINWVSRRYVMSYINENIPTVIALIPKPNPKNDFPDLRRIIRPTIINGKLLTAYQGLFIIPFKMGSQYLMVGSEKIYELIGYIPGNPRPPRSFITSAATF